MKIDGKYFTKIPVGGTKVATNVKIVKIESSDISVMVSGHSYNTIEAHIYYEDMCIASAERYFCVENGEIHIKDGYLGGYDRNKLRLEVILPSDNVFDDILVRTVSADITAEHGIFSRALNLMTVSGNIELHTVSKITRLASTLGDILIDVDGIQSARIKASSLEGSITARFDSALKVALNLKTLGNQDTYFTKGEGMYEISGELKTLNVGIEIE